MTAKTDLPPIPPALADVALIDGPQCASARGVSISTWHELVRAGKAPQPVIRSTRCTRWRLGDVRAWLIESAGQSAPNDAMVERAKRASAKAQAVRKARAAQVEA